MLSRSNGLHGAWQRAGRGSYGEKNGPEKSCEGRSDPQTSRLEEETPTATSFPQGANAILEQGEFLRVKWRNAVIKQDQTGKLTNHTDSWVCFAALVSSTKSLSNFLSA